MPSVSVVIPTLKRAQLVVRAVRSALAQTLADIEVIVVIDGVDEATVAGLGEIADPRLRHVVNPKSLGAGPARDRGAELATGQWVAFLDDDDEWLPEKLERQLALAPADGRAVITTNYRIVGAEGERIAPRFPYAGDRPIDEWLFSRQTWTAGHEAMVQTSSLMFPRAMFEVLRFRDTKQHEEWELCLRAVKDLGYAFLTVPEPLVIYYAPVSGPSLSRSYTYERSMAWADAVRGALLTPKGYSGFVLGVACHQASAAPRALVMAKALRSAFAYGQPTAKQVFAFFASGLMPPAVRKRLRFRRKHD